MANFEHIFKKSIMRIESINIKNTGVFADETIEFPSCPPNGAEIHIFTGPNGSGKSTILHSLAAGFNYKDVTGRCQVIHNDFYKRFHSFEKLEDGSHTSQIEIKLDNNDNIISYGCPICENMHIVTESEKIQKYQFQMNPKMTSNYEFDFALYASSGYRMIDYQDDNFAFYSNPLAQSLEFEKKNPQATSIEGWIYQALQNKYSAIGLAAEGNQAGIQTEIHIQVVERIKNAIRLVVGADFDFTLQLQPPKVRFKYGNSKNKLEFNVLAGGLKSLISWMIDLAQMLDSLHWNDKTKSILDQNIIIFLDEIEVHLHPL